MTKNLSEIQYRERVLPGLSFFLSGLALPFISTLIALPFIEELLWLVPTATYAAFLGFGFLLAPVITITKDYLAVGKATIPRSVIGHAIEIKASDAFAERGPKLKANAYIRFQIGVKGLVKIEVLDESDPTPYWLFASRNPDLVISYLNKGN